ncbi:MAG: hypothetical protein J5I90_15135 [Caldilineales bacterium]|nr:hypothetical protein [Caldilineales bacterium]
MSTLYEITLTLHSLIRWLVLIFLIASFVDGLWGWFGKREWQKRDDQLGMLSTITLDVQVLLGLLLYFVLSPITTSSFSNFGQAMGNGDIRFFLVEHFVIMIIAVVVAHMGRSRARKAATALSKFRNAAIFYGVALLLVLAAIPWQRLQSS